MNAQAFILASSPLSLCYQEGAASAIAKWSMLHSWEGGRHSRFSKLDLERQETEEIALHFLESKNGIRVKPFGVRVSGFLVACWCGNNLVHLAQTALLEVAKISILYFAELPETAQWLAFQVLRSVV